MYQRTNLNQVFIDDSVYFTNYAWRFSNKILLNLIAEEFFQFCDKRLKINWIVKWSEQKKTKKKKQKKTNTEAFAEPTY